jgi:hypothetical protein
MSVKDKIAMWNSLATAPAPPPPAPKLAVSANNPPKEQPKEKLPPLQPQENTLPLVTPTTFKKTESIEHHSPSLPTHTEHPSPPVEKPKPAVTAPLP